MTIRRGQTPFIVGIVRSESGGSEAADTPDKPTVVTL